MSGYKSYHIKIMKISLLRPPFLLSCLMACFLAGCDRNIDCQSPPPSFFFRVVRDGSIYPSAANPSAILKISYAEGGQQKYLTDLEVIDGFFTSSMIIERSWALDDPAFTLELNGQILTKIKLENYMNNARCQGWPSVSEVYENGQLAKKTENQILCIRA